MAIRDQKPKQGFLISTDTELDLSVLNRSIKKVLTAIKSILTLGWIPSSDAVDPDDFDVDKAREAQMANQNNMADIAHLYSRKY
ncbi:MAG: hypothetical protein HeimC2_00630 [Candidatus Heimdallarchaeota archaeon LC_2]|nr:MAG: hypothetical protein HeimC2_00630 [Candidatus Heimdallarchaeota archaeon LC_2]